MTTYTFPTPPDDLTTIFDRNDREWRRTPGGWQRQHNSFDAAVLPWKTLLINYGPLTTTDLTDTSELPDTTDSNSDARRIAELEQQITDHTRICRILENAQAQQHRDDAYTLHQPVERYQDSPDSDLSFDTATAAPQTTVRSP